MIGPQSSLFPEWIGCRCEAWVKSGEADRCLSEVEDGLAHGSEWLPDPMALNLLPALLRSGDVLGARRYAEHLLREVAVPPKALPAVLGVAARAEVGGPGAAGIAAFQVLQGRLLGALPATEAAEIVLFAADKLAEGGHAAAAERVLGTTPPAEPAQRDRWFRQLGGALGNQGREPALRALMARWVEAGGQAPIVALEHAFLADVHQQPVPGQSGESMLRDAIGSAPSDTPGELLSAVYLRLFGHVSRSGTREQALAIAEEAAARGAPLDPERVAEVERLQGAGAELATVSWIFDQLDRGDQLLVLEPEPSPVHDGPVELDAAEGPRWTGPRSALPLRWVWRNAAGAVVGSGTVLLDARDTEVRASRRPVVEPLPPGAPPPPGDGRRRVFVVLPDCGDWRILRYLAARGDLPAFSALVQRGRQGSLRSEPPFTGVAMQRIARPQVVEGLSVLRFVHRLGTELEGLESVATNPFAGLRWVTPADTDLTAHVAAADRKALNLLFSHGNIDAGRNAEIVGPGGARSAVHLSLGRAVAASEWGRSTDVRALDGEFASFFGQISAEFDAVVAQARSAEVDLVLLRVEQTDLLTHGTYARYNRTAQDDGEGDLFAAYRLVDKRLAELTAILDADDAVLFVSDHGIQSSLIHSPHAVFVVAGAGEPGSFVEQPPIDVFPRLLCELLGVAPDPRWPSLDAVRTVLGGTAILPP